MADSKLIRECDGATGYQEYKSDITNYAVLAEIEHVLEHPCPDPFEEPIAAGVWGDDEHPCEEDDERHGTAAPRETVAQRKASITAHKKADKRLKALILLKARKDLKKHAMSYKGDSGRELLEHLDKNFAATSSTKLGQLIKRFLTEKLVHATEILAFNIRKKDQIRELEEADVKVHPAVAVVCYLQNLSSEFETFCAVQMMKDALDLDEVMAGAIDFASSSAAVHYDEAKDIALYAGGGGSGSSSETVPAWARTLLDGNRGRMHAIRCSNCNYTGHEKSECFKPGGGLSHFSTEEKTAWLEKKRRARGKRPASQMDSVDVDKAMLSLARAQTARHKEDAERLRELKQRRTELAVSEIGL